MNSIYRMPIKAKANPNREIKDAKVYDIEVYKNFLLVAFEDLNGFRRHYYAFQDTDTKEYHGNLFQIWESVEDTILIGYNNKKFDNPLLCVILDNVNAHIENGYPFDLKSLYNIAQSLIKDKKHKYKDLVYNPYFDYIDMLEVLRKGYNMKPLKMMGVNLKHDRIQDLPYPFDMELSWEQAKEVISYCWNDVMITKKVYAHSNSKIKLRQNLIKEFDLKYEVLSSADSGLSDMILDRFYEIVSKKDIGEVMGLRTYRKYDIPFSTILNDKTTFDTEYLKRFLSEMKSISTVYCKKVKGQNKGKYTHRFPLELPPMLKKIGHIDKKETDMVGKFELECFGNTFSFGLGGIHTKDEAGILEPPEGYRLIDIDVTSYYPYRILVDRVCPKHLDSDIFLSVLKTIVDTRVEAKSKRYEHERFETRNQGLKRCINTIFGKFNFEYRWLYDPLCTYRITINNQIDILKICEMMHIKGFKVLSANTDGVTLLVKEDCLESFRDTYKEWERLTGFNMEETEYARVVRRDVNNYMAVENIRDKDDKIIKTKVKGKGKFHFDEDDLMGSWAYPIITMALNKYYQEGIDVKGYIKSFIRKDPKNIHYYLKSTKIDKSFTNYELEVVREKITHSPKTGKEYVRPKYSHTVIKEKELQDTLRYYAYVPQRIERKGRIIEYGTQIVKRKEERENTHQKDRFLKLFNDAEYREDCDYDIDFGFYIDEVYKAINKIKPLKI